MSLGSYDLVAIFHEDESPYVNGTILSVIHLVKRGGKETLCHLPRDPFDAIAFVSAPDERVCAECRAIAQV